MQTIAETKLLLAENDEAATMQAIAITMDGDHVFEKLLAKQDLVNMESGLMFAYGFANIEHPYGNSYEYSATTMAQDGTIVVKWVAVRGKGAPDWAIYHSFHSNLTNGYSEDMTDHLYRPYKAIADYGTKLRDPSKIKELVPCDKSAFNSYRF